MSQRRFGCFAAFFLAAALAAGAGWAQEAARPPADQSQPAEEKKPEAGIEEIIVTSRLREESIQDVPIAVSQFGEEAIKAIAPSTLRDFDGLTPNLFIGMNTAGPGASAIYIRGLGYADIEKTQTPNVGVVLDGVFIPSSTGQLIDTFDLESLEINRGPQAILWGRNTSGGTIVVRRGRPQLDDWGAKLLTTYGDFKGEGDGHAFKVQGVANIPLIEESMALRVGYTYKDEDGYAINQLTGENRGAIDYQAFNAKLLWEPTEDLSLLFNWDWIDDDSDIPPQDPTFDGDDPYVNRSDRDPEELALYNLSVVSLEANYELPFGARFTSISAYWDSHDLVYQDFDGGFSDPSNPTTSDPNSVFGRLHTRREQEFDVFSQELRLQGTALDEALTYIAGFYYARDDHDHSQRTEQQLQLPPAALAGVPGFDGVTCLGGVFDGPTSPTLGLLCALPTSFASQETHLTNHSWALFGSLEYELPWVEGLRVNGGVRWINEEKEFDTRFDAISNSTLVGSTLGANLLTLSGLEDSWDDVLFEAGVNYQVLDNLLGYYRFAQGFRSGGFSLRGSEPATRPITFEPEGTDAHEVGLKSSWLDGRLVLNAAGFYTTVDGGQFSSILSGVSAVGTNTLILNHGETEIYGVELQGNLEPVENVNIYFALGWQKGKIKESIQEKNNLAIGAAGAPGQAGVDACPNGGAATIAASTCDLAGSSLTRFPRLSGSLGASYRIEIGPGSLVLDGRWKHMDDIVIVPSFLGGNDVGQKNYELFETTISYEWQIAERNVRLAFVGRNLGDEQYLEQSLPLGAFGFQGWGPPRYLGAELSFEL